MSRARRDVVGQHRVWRCRDVVRDGFKKGLIGDERLLVAPADQHGRTLGGHQTGELQRQSRLADARFTRYEHHLPAAGQGFLPGLFEPLPFRVPPGKRCALEAGDTAGDAVGIQQAHRGLRAR